MQTLVPRPKRIPFKLKQLRMPGIKSKSQEEGPPERWCSICPLWREKPFVNQVRERVARRREYERRKAEIEQGSRPGPSTNVSQLTVNDASSDSEDEYDPSIFYCETTVSAVQDPKARVRKNRISRLL